MVECHRRLRHVQIHKQLLLSNSIAQVEAALRQQQLEEQLRGRAGGGSGSGEEGAEAKSSQNSFVVDSLNRGGE
jgi:hypothetical protein